MLTCETGRREHEMELRRQLNTNFDKLVNFRTCRSANTPLERYREAMARANRSITFFEQCHVPLFNRAVPFEVFNFLTHFTVSAS